MKAAAGFAAINSVCGSFYGVSQIAYRETPRMITLPVDRKTLEEVSRKHIVVHARHVKD
jgi:hypothetical protein